MGIKPDQGQIKLQSKGVWKIQMMKQLNGMCHESNLRGLKIVLA
jgi:hypothetical protein